MTMLVVSKAVSLNLAFQGLWPHQHSANGFARIGLNLRIAFYATDRSLWTALKALMLRLIMLCKFHRAGSLIVQTEGAFPIAGTLSSGVMQHFQCQMTFRWRYSCTSVCLDNCKPATGPTQSPKSPQYFGLESKQMSE